MVQKWLIVRKMASATIKIIVDVPPLPASKVPIRGMAQSSIIHIM